MLFFHLIAYQGKLVDASFIEAPRQLNSREESDQIKSGIIPQSWTEQPAKMRQKDTDAPWTKKNNQSTTGIRITPK